MKHDADFEREVEIVRLRKQSEMMLAILGRAHDALAKEVPKMFTDEQKLEDVSTKVKETHDALNQLCFILLQAKRKIQATTKWSLPEKYQNLEWVDQSPVLETPNGWILTRSSAIKK